MAENYVLHVCLYCSLPCAKATQRKILYCQIDATVLCVVQNFSIELIDAQGTNLITNGTYSLADVIVYKDNRQVNASSNSTNSAITFFPNGNNKGVTTYEIMLNNNQTKTLVLTLKEENKGNACCGPSFLITGAKYNSKPIEIIKNEGMLDKIQVVKKV